jgi:hypothetical protein
MIRNYRINDFESLDLTLTDVGSSQYSLRYDGLEGNAIADLELYSDASRLVPLSASDWEYYTTDTFKTTNEATALGSGKTVYKEIRILNPTYQTGSIYATFNNFGTYPDGSVLGIDYITIDDDYDYTTQRNLMTYLVCDGLSADITITVTDAGYDERSRFKVVNKDSSYIVTVSGDTDYYVEPGNNDTFFYDSAVMLSENWEDTTKAKAWVNFNGTGTVAIRDSYNVASITDLGVGLYRINFSTAMSDINYCVVGSASNPDGTVGQCPILSVDDANKTTTYFDVTTAQIGGSSANYYDPVSVYIQVFA